MADTAHRRTTWEIQNLKWNWLEDPCYDIEDAEGFEAHRDELLAFRIEQEALKEASWIATLEDKAEKIGCPLNTELAEYVLTLERRLEKLECAERRGR